MTTILLREPIQQATAQRILNEFDAAAGGPVELRICSEGGEVSAGKAIVGAMVRHQESGQEVRGVVEGVAASMAAVVALQCDHLLMPADAVLMFHRPYAGGGDADAQESNAGYLRDLEAGMVAMLSERTGLPAAQVAERIAATWWMSAVEAMSLGVANEVAAGAGVAARVDLDEHHPPRWVIDNLARGRQPAAMDLTKVRALLGLEDKPGDPEPPDPGEVKAKLDKQEATIAELRGDLETYRMAVDHAREVIAKLNEQADKAKADAKADKDRAASESLAKLGAMPVNVSKAGDPPSVEEQYKILCQRVSDGDPGAAKERQEFRRKHHKQLYGA